MQHLLEIEAEILFPYVRQFDGKWVKIAEASFDVDAYLGQLENSALLTVEKKTPISYHITAGPRARNLNFGILGVPDSEVYSDNLDYYHGQGTFFEENINFQQFS